MFSTCHQKGMVVAEFRVLQEKWTDSFFSHMSMENLCLICMPQIFCLKEHSIRRHYDSDHSNKVRHVQRKPRIHKAKELLSDLEKQTSIFNHSMEVGVVASKASYLIAKEIAVTSKPFCDVDLLRIVC